MKDYYKILGLDSTATLKEIKRAYKRLAKLHHPDKWVKESKEDQVQAEVEFKRIQEAYCVLKDPINRAHYDETGSGDMPKSKDLAVKKLIALFSKHIKEALEKEMAIDLFKQSASPFLVNRLVDKKPMDSVLINIRTELLKNIGNANTTVANLKTGVAKLNKYKRKVIRKTRGESNIYLQVIEQQLIATTAALAHGGIEQIALETALQSLNDYEFILDDAPELLIGGIVRTDGVA